MNKENQKDAEETSITVTKAGLEFDRYIVEKEYCGRIVSIRLTGHTMDSAGKFKNCEVKFADGKVFAGVMNEGDYSTLIQKEEGQEKITIVSSEICYLVLDEITGKIC